MLLSVVVIVLVVWLWLLLLFVNCSCRGRCSSSSSSCSADSSKLEKCKWFDQVSRERSRSRSEPLMWNHVYHLRCFFGWGPLWLLPCRRSKSGWSRFPKQDSLWVAGTDLSLCCTHPFSTGPEELSTVLWRTIAPVVSGVLCTRPWAPMWVFRGINSSAYSQKTGSWSAGWRALGWLHIRNTTFSFLL